MGTKRILTFAVLGAVGYWIYTRMRSNKSINPFAKSKSFTANEVTYIDSAYSDFASGRRRRGCEIVAGNVSVPIPHRLDNGDVIVKTGGGTTVVCPPNQQGVQGATS